MICHSDYSHVFGAWVVKGWNEMKTLRKRNLSLEKANREWCMHGSIVY